MCFSQSLQHTLGLASPVLIFGADSASANRPIDSILHHISTESISIALELDHKGVSFTVGNGGPKGAGLFAPRPNSSAPLAVSGGCCGCATVSSLGFEARCLERPDHEAGLVSAGSGGPKGVELNR